MSSSKNVFKESLDLRNKHINIDPAMLSHSAIGKMVEHHQLEHAKAFFQFEEEKRMFFDLYTEYVSFPQEERDKVEEYVHCRATNPKYEPNDELDRSRVLSLQQALVSKDHELKRQYLLFEFHGKMINDISSLKSKIPFFTRFF